MPTHNLVNLPNDILFHITSYLDPRKETSNVSLVSKTINEVWNNRIDLYRHNQCIQRIYKYMLYYKKHGPNVVIKSLDEVLEETEDLKNIDDPRNWLEQNKEKLKCVRSLNLSGLDLTDFPTLFVPYLPELQTLDLSDNDLSTLPKQLLESLKLVHISCRNNKPNKENLISNNFKNSAKLVLAVNEMQLDIVIPDENHSDSDDDWL